MLLLHIITYDLLLRVSTLIPHLQGARCARLNLHICIILARHKGLSEDGVLTSKHVAANHM